MKLVFVVCRDGRAFAVASDPADPAKAREKALETLANVARTILDQPGVDLSIHCESVSDDWQPPKGC